MDFHAYEQQRRLLWIEVFKRALRELHADGMVYRYLRRPSEMLGYAYDHIYLTATGLRRIDVGTSALREALSPTLFDRFVKRQLEELGLFRRSF